MQESKAEQLRSYVLDIPCGDGRTIRFAATPCGRDCVVFVTGGAEHIGAVALGTPEGKTWMRQCEEHREGDLAERVAQALAPRAQCVVCVVAGIHFDGLQKEGIEAVLAAVDVGIEAMCRVLDGP